MVSGAAATVILVRQRSQKYKFPPNKQRTCETGRQGYDWSNFSATKKPKINFHPRSKQITRVNGEQGRKTINSTSNSARQKSKKYKFVPSDQWKCETDALSSLDNSADLLNLK